jgi:hypothetical protein
MTLLNVAYSPAGSEARDFFIPDSEALSDQLFPRSRTGRQDRVDAAFYK